MIAILYENNVVAAFIDQVLSVDGDSIKAVDGGAKGIGHSVLIVDGYTYNDEDQTITNGTITIGIGDTINQADFADSRSLLAQTPEQYDKQRLADLELVIADAYERGIL